MFAIQKTIYGNLIIWIGEVYNESNMEDIPEDHPGQTYFDFDTTPKLPFF